MKSEKPSSDGKANAKVTEAYEHARVMLEALPVGCCLLDNELNLIDWNSAVLTLAEATTNEEFAGHYPNCLPEFQPNGEVSYDFAHSRAKIALEQGYCAFEATYQTVKFEPVPLWVTYVRMAFEGETAILVTLLDLRHQKELGRRLELELRRSLETEKRIESIMCNLPGVVFQCRYSPPHNTFTFASGSCSELLGYTSEEMIGKSLFELLENKTEDYEEIEKANFEAFKNGLAAEANLCVVTCDGKEKWIWERSRVIERDKDGTPLVIEGYYADVTARRKLDAAEMANRAKSNFLAVMSHEIRTPMNSIMGFAELARDVAIVPKVKDYLGKITDSATWLLNIINDILDISKIESGKFVLDKSQFTLHDVISRCQSVILPIIKEKELELCVYAEPTVGKKLVGDPIRLYQVLINLLSNAVKFTDSGKIKLSALVNETALEPDKVTVFFEVKDSGIGMTAEQLETIFDPFIQADTGRTRTGTGTGLGLSIAKNIVWLMGGDLLAESVVGEGSSFKFEITFEAIPTDESSGESVKLREIERPYFKSAVVLVCDDNYMNQQVICGHLARVGIEAVIAENGKLGVEKVRERAEKQLLPFDLIFMDIFMPVMDGIEAAARIKEMGCKTPVVAMTANIMTSELENYRKCGMLDCLGKPFTSQELWRVLLKYIIPVNGDFEDLRLRDAEDDAELERTLYAIFLQRNRHIYAALEKAISIGDTVAAHRIVHTLKGNAGQIRKPELQEAASAVERLLKIGEEVPKDVLREVENELLPVLEELDRLVKSNTLRLDDEQVSALFERLKLLCSNLDPDCLELTEALRAIPETEKLIEQIEEFDLRGALETLTALIDKHESKRERSRCLNRKSRLLVIDDEVQNIKVLAQILKPEYAVYAVRDGKDVMKAVEEHCPDLILLDIIMPEPDGYAVLKELKANRATKSVPVILVSGLRDTSAEEKGLLMGAADYITKPFSPAIVKLRVQNQLQIAALVKGKVVL